MNNDLTIAVYTSLTTLIPDPSGELLRATGVRFQTGYPGGLHLSASFSVRRKVAEYWRVQGAQRLTLSAGLTIVWEGVIDDLAEAIARGGSDVTVTARGWWGFVLEQRSWRKRWADNRLTEDVWVWQEDIATYTAAELCETDRNNRIRFTPRGEQWASGAFAAVRYTMPTGETIKRVTCNYAFSELAAVHPSGVMFYDDSAATYTVVADGDSVTLDTADWLYIYGDESVLNVSGLGFVLSALNNNAAVADVEVYDGAWTNVAALSDGTDAAGATLGQSGNMVFTEIENCNETTVNGKSGRFLRLGVSATLDAVTITTVSFLFAQSWELRLRDTIGGADIWSVTATGSGSQDSTLATPRQYLELQFISRAAQLGINNGSVYGQVSSVVVYSETGSINSTEIIKDIRAKFTGINADESNIASNTLDLTPFLTEGWERASDIANRAASFGDSSANAWAVGFLTSEYAKTFDGKGVLFYEQQPVLTDYDYVIRLDELVTPVLLRRDSGNIWNWIVVGYTDALGRQQYLTPDDDASLTDATSVSTYGQRDYVLSYGQITSTEAADLGQRFLAQYKDPKYSFSAPLLVRGNIRAKAGNPVPACRIRAGKRIKIENYLRDLSGTGLTALISMTDYDADTQTCSITLGQPDSLAVRLARMGR